jgi:nicotinate-nucleotide--dimethylbenzimidazole phosphoribosyltransferase
VTVSRTPGWLNNPAYPTDTQARNDALTRQSQLTKPPGSLCQLEEVAVQLAMLQGTPSPSANKINIVVFAADHGIAAEGTSAFPQAVTGEMVKNFAAGGAAISVMARHLNASLEVVNLGCINDPGELSAVVNCTLGAGTANATLQAALSEQQLIDALTAGREAVQRAQQQQCELFIGGDMGIGNTASATAVSCALLDQAAENLTGPGTGLDDDGVARKARIIQRALDLHRPHIHDPMEALRRLGGFEIAALSGAFIASAQVGLPVLVDGFIAGCAALVATQHVPAVRDWLLFGHHSAEPGHSQILDKLNAKPLLNLGLRLGEGSGAAAAVPLIRLACSLHNDMATFSEAGVSGAR